MKKNENENETVQKETQKVLLVQWVRTNSRGKVRKRSGDKKVRKSEALKEREGECIEREMRRIVEWKISSQKGK